MFSSVALCASLCSQWKFFFFYTDSNKGAHPLPPLRSNITIKKPGAAVPLKGDEFGVINEFFKILRIFPPLGGRGAHLCG
jgi:hypothetical protein